MGMFDTLRVNVKMPGYTEIPDEEFQTKSLGSFMEHYVISSNGELYKELWEYECIENKSNVFGGTMKKIEGSYRREYLTKFHGDIIFYASRSVHANNVWREYTARFTEGKLSRIWYEDKHY